MLYVCYFRIFLDNIGKNGNIKYSKNGECKMRKANKKNKSTATYLKKAAANAKKDGVKLVRVKIK